MSMEIRGADTVGRNLTNDHLWSVPMTALLKQAAAEGEAAAAGRVRGMASVSASLHHQATSLQARVWSTHPAAVQVEVGRRPGGKYPPVAAIDAWMRRHGIGGSAFVIARGIAMRGIKGRRFMRAARSRMRTRMRQYLKQAAADVVAEWKRL